MTLALFLAIAAVALVSGAMVVAGRSPGLWLRVCSIACGCAYVQVMAPMPGVLLMVVLAGAAVPALQAVQGAEERAGGRWWRVAACVGVAGVATALVSTWARQYVWTGRELGAGSTFGTAEALGATWGEAYAPALVAGLLVVLVATLRTDG